MKLKTLRRACALPLLAVAGFAQTTGVAHPEQDATDAAAPVAQADHYVKPSHAAVAVPTATPAYAESYPATGPASAAVTRPEPVLIPRGAVTADEAAERGSRRVAETVHVEAARPETTDDENAVTEDVTSGIVMRVPGGPHQLVDGTLLKARLRETLDTRTTAEGTVFTAELTADVGHGGEVMLPAGSLIRGHVNAVHGGKRISGGAAMHLRPETISLPDGTLYRLDAHLTELNSTQDLRVKDEGTIVVRSSPKAAAAVVGGVTATAAVTGAVVGGGVGAAVGALAGAGVATAVYLRRDLQEHVPVGTNVVFALDEGLTVTPR